MSEEGDYLKSLVHDSGIEVKHSTCHWTNKFKKITIITPSTEQMHKTQEVVVDVIMGHILLFFFNKKTLYAITTLHIPSLLVRWEVQQNNGLKKKN